MSLSTNAKHRHRRVLTTSLSLVAAMISLALAAGGADARQSFNCSETGDVCVGLVLGDDGSLVILNQYAADYVDRAKVCWIAPGDRERCSVRRVVPSGTAWVARVIFEKPAPGRWQGGTGGFVAALTVPRGRDGSREEKSCPGSRVYGPSRIRVSRVTGPVSCTVAKSAAQLAVAYRVENGFPDSFCARGWCWKWGAFTGRGEGASIARFVGRRGDASIVATQQVA